MSFKSAMQRVFDAEGGYSDHPDDKGGPTNYGITLSTLKGYRPNETVTKEDVKNLTKAEAEAIYKKNYWDPLGCDLISNEDTQLILFDQGVNRGVKTAAMQAQVVATDMGSRLGVDGKIGTISGHAINGIDPESYQREYLQASEHAYVNIVKRNSSQITFLSGWLNRVHNLQDICWFGVEIAPVTPIPKPEVTEDTDSSLGLHPIDWLRNEMKLGAVEIPGSKHNPRIVEYHKHSGNIGGEKATHPDEVPWCSSVLQAAADACGMYKTDNALASSWDKYVGEKLKIGDWVEEGDIIRLAHPGGHVTLANKRFQWTGKGTFDGLGGNQSNRIKVSTFSQSTIVSIHRWKPKKGVMPKVKSASSGGGTSGDTTR